MTSSPTPRRYRSHLLALEPRMMFDAAAAVVAQDLAQNAAADRTAPTDAHDLGPVHLDPTPVEPAHPGDVPGVDGHGDPVDPIPDSVPVTLDHPGDNHPGDTGGSATTGSREIIFIDTAVADYEQLATEWADRGTVVLIDGTKDGIDQMRGALAGQSDIAAIHIVSHGAEGSFWLGTTKVDSASIAGDLSASLGAIGRSLAIGGDILIYGCDFAEGADGARALAAFADATHADVAASTDVTGYALRGGDWTLEAHHGAIEARELASADWVHTLDPNTPVPISVAVNSLTVRNAAGTVVFSSADNYNNNATRSPDVGVGAVATWANAATYQGHSVDLKATVVSLTTGDAVQFNRVTGTGTGPDDPTFLLRDLTTGNTPAIVEIRWELVDHTTGEALPADVRFTIADIDGIGGNPNTRESVSASTANLAYFTRERISDINFTSSLNAITASGTQDENNPVGNTLTSKSAATFDWSAVSAFTLTYTLTPNAVTSQAQFYHDGDADFVYTDPVYVSVPRLDLDGNDSTAPGNDAHFTFTENGPGVPIVDSDVVVSNPMDIDSITGATVTLTNYKAGDGFAIGASLPGNVTATIGAVTNGTLTITLTGLGSEDDYAAALRAISFANSSDTPDTTQRVLNISFSNDTLTSAVATSRIDVVPVNDAPVRVGTLPARSTQDAATVSYATAGGFADPDGDTLAYSATGLPTGLTINAATGVISGTIDRSASQPNGGVYTVTVTARDPSNATTTQSFTITVTNPPPVAVNDSAITAEDTPVTIAVLANDSDPDGDPLTVTTASALHGTVTRNADNTLTYRPNADYNGSDTISYTISDGNGGTSNATVAVTITPVNDAPVAVGTLPTRSDADAASVSFGTAAGFTDVDGDTLTYAVAGLPAGLVIDAATGVISGTIDRSASQMNGGRYTVTVTARDSAGATATQSFTYTVANPAPIAVGDSVTTPEDTPVVIAVLANDTDPDGDPLTVTAASALHGQVVRNADGTLTYTPDADYNGTDTITYTISDGEGGTSTATVAVTITPVNDAPRPAPSQTDYATVDGQAVNASVRELFTDIDGDMLTYSATGLPAGLTFDPATGIISGTIDRSASQVNGGRYTVVFTATDPSGASATQTGTITVTNPAPVATDDGVTTSEDTPVIIPVLANDRDPDGDPLTVTAATALHGQVVRNADGTLTYIPDADYNGPDTISYTISDGQGGTASAIVAVTVTPVNDAPVAEQSLPDQSTLDGSTVGYPTAAAFGDVDGDTLGYSATGLPAGLTIDAATGLISGTVDPSASQANGGRYTVIVTARDSGGLSATQSFAITIANPGPVATDDRTTTHVDTPVTIAVLANDSDPDGDLLTVTGAIPARGSVAVMPDGTLRYTPPAGYAGRDTITYTISDGQGGTATATVTIDITDGAPTAPLLADIAAVDGQPVALPVGAGFTDPDGDPLTFTASGLPPGLSIDPATGAITGTIDRSASVANGGVYDSVITADDGHGGVTSRTLRWTIANPAPVATDDVATTDEDTPVTIPVLANDRDPDGDPLTVVAAVAGHGTVTINPDGTLTYRPAADFNGTDTIVYAIDDGQGGRATASVTVTVNPVDDAPTSTDLPPRFTADGATVTLPLAPAFADAEGDTLDYAATGLPPGLSIDPVTGLVSGMIVPGSANGGPAGDGIYRVVVTVTDPSGRSVEVVFDWTVTQLAPDAADDSATTAEDTPVTIPVLANDSDPDGDPLTIVDAVADHGTVAIVGGTLVFTPARDFNGVATITYAVTDPAGNRATATVTVTVTPANDAPVATPLPDPASRDGQDVVLDIGGFFADPDGDALRFTATGLPPGLTIDPVTGRIAGTLDRGASQIMGGVYRVTITATDPSGERVESSFDWTIVNPAPSATDDVATTREDVGITIAVLANDSDPDGDPLTVVAAEAMNGTVTINPDGTIGYVPNPGFHGSDMILYTIADGNGGRASASVLVTVTAVNADPVAVDDTARTDQETGVVIPVLANDRDPDGDPLTIVSAVAGTGTATIQPHGTIRYVPGADFTGTDTIRYTIADGQGGTATAAVTITVDPVNHAPIVPGRDPVDAVGGRPVVIDALAGVTDRDGDPLTVTSASSANGTVTVNRDGTIAFTPALGFVGSTTITYSVSDGRGGVTSATIVVRVADGRGADIEQLLRIGQVSFRDPTPSLATIALPASGEVRNPLSLLATAEGIRSLNTTMIGRQPVGDAVEAIRSLRGTYIDPDQPITAEVARLDALRDQRDMGDRLFDHRWSDFDVKGLTGFSVAADRNACIMIDSVVRGGAVYLEVRDTATEGRRAPIRSVDIRMAHGDRAPEWIRVDHRGLAIIERGADMDELHLIVRVTRADGRTSSTPIVVQGATGEIELDRHAARRTTAAPLDSTLHSSRTATAAHAARLASHFE